MYILETPCLDPQLVVIDATTVTPSTSVQTGDSVTVTCADGFYINGTTYNASTTVIAECTLLQTWKNKPSCTGR